ncbi:hypothetical protein OIU76_005632 [Salix suchowensis]|nr:hypothetical protein OIU78_015521 [Salix suchowensis]KAJ6343930.1 hypothetical protein OIU76_005632 [Salix suchowensis]
MKIIPLFLRKPEPSVSWKQTSHRSYTDITARIILQAALQSVSLTPYLTKSIPFLLQTKGIDPGPISRFWSMGTFKKEKCEANQECPEKKVRAYMFSLWSFLASMAGGLLLLWWDYEYHPTNSQLWMVPLGLILFFTPAIAWFAVVVSGTCNYKVDDDNSHKTSELVLQVRRLS